MNGPNTELKVKESDVRYNSFQKVGCLSNECFNEAVVEKKHCDNSKCKYGIMDVVATENKEGKSKVDRGEFCKEEYKEPEKLVSSSVSREAIHCPSSKHQNCTLPENEEDYVYLKRELDICNEDHISLGSAVDLYEGEIFEDDFEDDIEFYNEQTIKEDASIPRPTLLELSKSVKSPVSVTSSASSYRSCSRSSTDKSLPAKEDPLNFLPPPPPFSAPPPPPLPYSYSTGPKIPAVPQTPAGILKKSPVRTLRSSSQSTSQEEIPVPGPSYFDPNLPDSALRQENSEMDANLNFARERFRLMLDNINRFVPLGLPDPDHMQLEELQRAMIEFGYLEQDFLDAEDFLEFGFEGLDLDIPTFSEKAAEPAFARGVEVKTECQICFDDVKLFKRICCDFPVCDPCMERYIETNVTEGTVKIQCIGSSCDAFLYRDEILGRLSVPMKDKYYKFLVDANKDPKVKTCPRCSSIHNISDGDLEHKTKYGLQVTCSECLLEWCFECQAPWHTDIKCKEFRKGDKLVKTWAKEKHYGHANAQRCPKCKIFIERKGGCDHMTCSKCDTGFCYKCGGRYLDVKFFGNHLSRYSPLGCKYNFKPNRPVLRKFIRGSIFGAKLLGGVVLVSLGVAAVGVLLGASVVILPAFGAYKYRKYRKLNRRLKRQQELIKMRSKNAMMELHRERPYMLEPPPFRVRDSLQDIRVRDRTMRRSSWSAVNEAVHIGIQTGQSQQVNVTVHNPYQPDTLVANEDTQNSEIQMSITDEWGQVTVSTAEISHNSNTGDGSEAEIVLHVKTSYPKNEKEAKVQMNEASDTATVEKPDVTKTELETKCDSKDSDSLPKFSSPQALDNRPESAQVHRRVHSTGSVRKNIKKQEFGSISRKWRLKSLSGRKASDGDLGESTVPNNQDQSESLNIPEDKKPSIDPDDNSETDNLTQSGCFLKLLGKKLNTYQNQLEKEKHFSAKSETNLGERLNCPDVVSCALKAELKSKENLDTEGHSTGVKVKEKDAYLGIISAETDTTYL